MKKALIVLAVVAILAGGVLALGLARGWFSGESEGGDRGVQEPVSRPTTPKDKRQELVTMEGRLRLESLAKASPGDVSKAVGLWAGQEGIEREISWQVVRVGAGADQPRQTRLRACQLAVALAGAKPEGQPRPLPSDPAAVEPLLKCLDSGDGAVASAAVSALGVIHVHNPTLKVKDEVLPRARKLLGEGSAELALAGAAAATAFGEASLAPEICAAWERHAKAEGFSEACRLRLRTLLELHLKAGLKKPGERPAPEEIANARRAAMEKASELGTDIAKWKVYWAEALGEGKAP